jgi:hypothetical protein
MLFDEPTQQEHRCSADDETVCDVVVMPTDMDEVDRAAHT